MDNRGGTSIEELMRSGNNSNMSDDESIVNSILSEINQDKDFSEMTFENLGYDKASLKLETEDQVISKLLVNPRTEYAQKNINKIFEIGVNETVFIPAGAIHRIENYFKIPVKIIEVQTGSVLRESDIVRYQDIYGRIK